MKVIRKVVYDFDGTIFDSPDDKVGKKAYYKATGKNWEHRGWWGKLGSLCPPIVPDPIPEDMFIMRTVDAIKKDMNREDTKIFMMTGRPVFF